MSACRGQAAIANDPEEQPQAPWQVAQDTWLQVSGESRECREGWWGDLEDTGPSKKGYLLLLISAVRTMGPA